MHAIQSANCSALASLSQCFQANGEDLFGDFLHILIVPEVPSGLTPDLVQSVWYMVTTPGDDLISRQQAVGVAFLASESPNDLAVRWANLLVSINR